MHPAPNRSGFLIFLFPKVLMAVSLMALQRKLRLSTTVPAVVMESFISANRFAALRWNFGTSDMGLTFLFRAMELFGLELYFADNEGMVCITYSIIKSVILHYNKNLAPSIPIGVPAFYVQRIAKCFL